STSPTAAASGSPVTTAAAVTSSSASAVPSVLPFTGIDLETLLITGISLVVLGLLLMSSARQQRRALRVSVRWLLGE
ncbi:MAG TPA: hypothetical protein VEJ84_00995, partial [Acidimicrobiales bacterium]|nr:hypothetical protein [Acidimicrobiales bacterium]